MSDAPSGAPDWLTPRTRTSRGRLRAALTARGHERDRPTLLEVVGEVLAGAGLLVVLFGTWLLFWTDVTAQAAHQQIVDDLAWEIQPAPEATSKPPATVPEPDPTATLFTTGTTIAVLRIPKLGDDYIQPVSEGVDKRTVLDVLGIGHYPDTALPGQIGNFGLAGHRTTFGKPFNRLDELTPGDELIVDTPEARYTYTVTASMVVSPSQVDVLAPEPGQPGATPTRRWITLTTCEPEYSARQRLIVRGELTSWTPKGTPR